jgi:hypothetical protein
MTSSGSRRGWGGRVLHFLFVSATVGSVLVLGSISQAHGQSGAALTRRVTVRSEPPGAMVWTKDGRNLVCTNTLTPGTIELEFHDTSDVRKVLLRRFGYADKNLEITPSDEKIGATLGEPTSYFFVTADNAPADLKKLNTSLKEEFQKAILDDPEALRCVPLELDSMAVVKNQATSEVTLLANISLDRSFGGSPFRVASRALRAEQPQKMGAVALESGIADLMARLRRITAGFPEVKVIQVACMYSGTQPYLDTDVVSSIRAETTQRTVYVTQSHYALGPSGYQFVTQSVPVMQNVTRVVPYNEEVSSVSDREVEKAITFVISAAEIPDTMDKKTVTDAVLRYGNIIVSKARPK